MKRHFSALSSSILVPILGAALLPLGADLADAKGPKLSISKKDCQRLVRHQARADVNYRAGVDVRGRRVAPADLNGGSRIKIPNTISFDVKFDIKNYLGKAEADAKAASAASISADKAKSAATSAATAATSATSAATEAQDLADTAKKAAKTAADTAYTAAVAASKADPGNNALDLAVDAAKVTADAATTEYNETQAEAEAVAASATAATTAANNAADATSAEGKASAAKTAATAAAAAATSKADLLAAANTASTSTTAASDAVTVSEGANTENINAHQAAADIGKNLGDGVVGKVKYNLSSGRLTFNGQTLGGGDQRELAEKCRSVLSGGR